MNHILFGLMTVITTTVLFLTADPIPTVFMTGDYQCVSVVNSDNTTSSCDKLPNKYHTVFVSNLY